MCIQIIVSWCMKSLFQDMQAYVNEIGMKRQEEETGWRDEV